MLLLSCASVQRIVVCVRDPKMMLKTDYGCCYERLMFRSWASENQRYCLLLTLSSVVEFPVFFLKKEGRGERGGR